MKSETYRDASNNHKLVDQIKSIRSLAITNSKNKNMDLAEKNLNKIYKKIINNIIACARSGGFRYQITNPFWIFKSYWSKELIDLIIDKLIKDGFDAFMHYKEFYESADTEVVIIVRWNDK